MKNLNNIFLLIVSWLFIVAVPSANADETVTVPYTITGVKGNTGDTLTFKKGETTKEIKIPIKDIDSKEKLSISAKLGTPSGGVTVNQENNDASITFLSATKNDGVVNIAVDQSTINEGDSGTTFLAYTVSRDDSAARSSVDWTLTGVSADDLGARQATSGTVEFAAGETQQSFSVEVKGDTTIESDETIEVTLSNPGTNLTLGTQVTATTTIKNDDVDYCADSPCQNGGQCSNDQEKKTFQCTCAEGYEGKTCADAIQKPAVANDDAWVVLENSTDNHGYLLSNDHAYHERTGGKVGVNENNAYVKNTEAKHGKVHYSNDWYQFMYTPDKDYVGTDSFQYSFVYGETGAQSNLATVTITVQKNYCSDSPCQNGGQCSNDQEKKTFQCTCAEGYEGKTCADAINKPPVAQKELPTITAYEKLAITPYALPEGLFKDEDGDELTLSIEGLPEGLSFDSKTQTISGTPAEKTAKEYKLEVKADDKKGGIGSAQLTISVVSARIEERVWENQLLPGDKRAGTLSISANASRVEYTQASHGRISYDAEEFYYYPEEGYVGEDKFEYTYRHYETGEITKGFVTINVYIDYCAYDPKNPCQNGAQCTNIREKGTYQCTCPEGFSGINCEVDDRLPPREGTVKIPAEVESGALVSISSKGWRSPINTPRGGSDYYRETSPSHDWKEVVCENITATARYELIQGGINGESGQVKVPVNNTGETQKCTVEVNVTSNETGGILNIKKTFNLLPANRQPNAVDDSVATDENLAFGENEGARVITADILGNDSDPDAGDKLTVKAIDTTGTTGLVTLVGGVVSYDPNGAFASLATGASVVDTFRYTVSDGNGGTDVATVTVTVKGTNDAPVVKKKIEDMEKTIGDSILIDAYDVFSDADGDSLIVELSGQPNSLRVNQGAIPTALFIAASSFVPGDVGEHTITVTAKDNKGGEVSTSFKLTVNPAKTILNDDKEARKIGIRDCTDAGKVAYREGEPGNYTFTCFESSKCLTGGIDSDGDAVNDLFTGKLENCEDAEKSSDTASQCPEGKSRQCLKLKKGVCVLSECVAEPSSTSSSEEQKSGFKFSVDIGGSEKTIASEEQISIAVVTKIRASKKAIRKLKLAGRRAKVNVNNEWTQQCDGDLGDGKFLNTNEVKFQFKVNKKGRGQKDGEYRWTAPANNTGKIQNCTLTLNAQAKIKLRKTESEKEISIKATNSVIVQVKPTTESLASAKTTSKLTGGSVTASPSEVLSGGKASVSTSGWSSENLSYTWSANCNGELGSGEFNDNKAQVEWTAPENISNQDNTCTITVDVKDRDDDASSTASTEVKVKAAKTTVDSDDDGDGVAKSQDCDDADPSVHPGASEICDNRDNNCDGTVDEGLKDCPTSPKIATFGELVADSDEVKSGENAIISYNYEFSDGEKRSKEWRAECTGALKALEGITLPSNTKTFNWKAPENNTGKKQTCTFNIDVSLNGDSKTLSKTITVLPVKTSAAKDKDKPVTLTVIPSDRSEITEGSLYYLLYIKAKGLEQNGLKLPYKISGDGITADDFIGGTLEGEVTLYKNSTDTLSLRTKKDGVFEGDETFTITLKLPSGMTMSSESKLTHTFKIKDKDDVDKDGDGYAASKDCDDTNPDIYPDHAEYCDGIDNNCDGVVDEGLAEYGCSTSPGYKEAKPVQIEFNIEKITQAEGTAGESEYLFTVRVVNGPVDKQVKARYSVTGSGDNKASANDFVGNVFPSGVLTIPAKAQGNMITIKVKGDTVKEPTEQFTITLSEPSSGVEIVESGKSSTGIIEDGNGVGSTDTSFADSNQCPACMNGGQCTDGKTCTCPAGFSGEICELTDSNVAGSKPKKEFKLAKRSFLLMDSKLRSGSSPTQVESLTTSVTAITNPTTTFTPIALTASGAPLVDNDNDGFPGFAPTAIEVRVDALGTNTLNAVLDGTGATTTAFTWLPNGAGQAALAVPGNFVLISPAGAIMSAGAVDIIVKRTTDNVFFKISINWSDDGGVANSTLNSLSGFNCGTSQANCP